MVKQADIIEGIANLNDWEVFPIGIGKWAIRKTPSGLPQLVYCVNGISKENKTWHPVVFSNTRILLGIAEGIADTRLVPVSKAIDSINGKNEKPLPTNTKTLF